MTTFIARPPPAQPSVRAAGQGQDRLGAGLAHQPHAAAHRKGHRRGHHAALRKGRHPPLRERGTVGKGQDAAHQSADHRRQGPAQRALNRTHRRGIDRVADRPAQPAHRIRQPHPVKDHAVKRAPEPAAQRTRHACQFTVGVDQAAAHVGKTGIEGCHLFGARPHPRLQFGQLRVQIVETRHRPLPWFGPPHPETGAAGHPAGRA